ncbi:MAG: transcription termination/antitermination protein NusA [Candidatus Niyogibacteria bacterium]|nr:transcription termination/antitermination protein NusA [Candidatus Niyogibacteria bacterium]
MDFLIIKYIMLDLKTLQSALEQLEAERGISKEQIIETIEMALAAAYKKEYGQRGQIIRAEFDIKTGKIKFFQIKIVVDESMLKPETEEETSALAESEAEIAALERKLPRPLSTEEIAETEEEARKIRFNPERHIMLKEAKKIKKGVKTEEELIFPLETKEDYGRIAAQTAKQVIIQRIREAERNSVFNEFKDKEGEVISGIVQRVEGRNVFLDLGRATGLLPAEEQVKGERYRIGERIKVLLFSVDQSVKGPSFYLSRTHPRLISKLFEIEVPEVASGTVEIKGIVREPGSRSKIAVISNEEGVDPVGSCVGQKGVRVNTITAELGGEKIDIIEWSENPEMFIANALSPAKVLNVDADEKKKEARATVAENQLSLAIGKGGQNVRLAARLTGWKIDIQSQSGESIAKATEEGEISGENIEKEK